MKYLKTLCLLAFMMSAVAGVAQTVVLQVEEAIDSTEDNSGPNRQFYTHSTYSLGFLAGATDPTAPVAFGKAIQFKLGSLVKLKWSNTFASCIELALAYGNMPFKQTATKAFPDTIQHLRQSLQTYSVQFNIFQRVNYGRRGDVLGNYVDVGAGLNWSPLMMHSTKDNGADGTVTRVSQRKLPYRRSIGFNAIGRVGFGSFYFYGQCRLTPMIKSGFGDPQLPALTIGLGFAA